MVIFCYLFIHQMSHIMTYTLKITPAAAAVLDGYCRAAGYSLRSVLSQFLTQKKLPNPATPAAEPLYSPIALPGLPPAPAPAEAAAELPELPEHDIDEAFDNFMTR